jgi:hypothetical protein
VPGAAAIIPRVGYGGAVPAAVVSALPAVAEGITETPTAIAAVGASTNFTVDGPDVWMKMYPPSGEYVFLKTPAICPRAVAVGEVVTR